MRHGEMNGQSALPGNFGRQRGGRSRRHLPSWAGDGYEPDRHGLVVQAERAMPVVGEDRLVSDRPIGQRPQPACQAGRV